MKELDAILSVTNVRVPYARLLKAYFFLSILWLELNILVVPLFLFFVILFPIQFGVSPILLIAFFIGILYSNTLVRNLGSLTHDDIVKVASIFDNMLLAILGIFFFLLSAIAVGTAATITTEFYATIFDLSLLGSITLLTIVLLAFFIIRRRKLLSRFVVYILPFGIQLALPGLLVNYNLQEKAVLQFGPATFPFLLIPFPIIWYFKRSIRIDDPINKLKIETDYKDKTDKLRNSNSGLYFAEFAAKLPLDAKLERLEVIVGSSLYYVGIYKSSTSIRSIRIMDSDGRMPETSTINMVVKIILFRKIAEEIATPSLSFNRLLAILLVKISDPIFSELKSRWEYQVTKQTSNSDRRRLDITGIKVRILQNKEMNLQRKMYTLLSCIKKCPSEWILDDFDKIVGEIVLTMETEIVEWTQRASDYEEIYPRTPSLRLFERLMGSKKTAAAERLEQVKMLADLFRKFQLAYQEFLRAECQNSLALVG